MASGQTLDDFIVGGGYSLSGYPVATAQDTNGRVCYKFVPSADGRLVFDSFLNRQYGGGGVTFVLVWYCDAIAGNVAWDVAVERLNAGIVLTASPVFSEVGVTVAASVQIGTLVYTSIAFTDTQFTPQVGEIYRVRVRRDITVTGNSGGNAWLLRVVAKET